jgi:hypothetical protein
LGSLPNATPAAEDENTGLSLLGRIPSFAVNASEETMLELRWGRDWVESGRQSADTLFNGPYFGIAYRAPGVQMLGDALALIALEKTEDIHCKFLSQ